MLFGWSRIKIRLENLRWEKEIERRREREGEKNLLLAKKDDTLKHAHSCPVQIKKKKQEKAKETPKCH